jgi:hypothetical protein
MSGAEDSASRLDRAIDDLLREPARPVPVDDEGLLPTARLLLEALPRLHPRFRFEEHLAARLAAAGRAAAAAPASSGRPGAMPFAAAAPIPLRHRVALTADEHRRTADRRRRSLVAGGAIASGVSLAIPLAGAAYVAWRRSRSSGGLL